LTFTGLHGVIPQKTELFNVDGRFKWLFDVPELSNGIVKMCERKRQTRTKRERENVMNKKTGHKINGGVRTSKRGAVFGGHI
jgi:hypothetical protein